MTDFNAVHTQHSVCCKSTRMKEEIYHRPEWHGNLPQEEAEDLLGKESPNTYLLRGSHLPDMFYLSFVGSDLKIEHLYFMLDQEKKEWFYKNGDPHHLTSLELLIPQMMHCPAYRCLPLNFL